MPDIVGQDTLCSLWDDLAMHYGKKTFLVFQDEAGAVVSYTYQEFHDEIIKTANLFLLLGVEKGERVALQMHTSPEFLMCLFGLTRIGAIVVPLNDHYVEEECKSVLRACSATCVVAEPRYQQHFINMQSEGWSFPRGVLVARAQTLIEGALDFEALKNAQASAQEREVTLFPQDVAEVIFTSGTTSLPKGVTLTHANFIFSGIYGAWQTVMTEHDRMLTTMPACHSNFQFAALTPVLCAHATLIVVEKYSATRFWRQIIEYKATLTQCVAMMLRTLLCQPAAPEERSHCLRDILYFLPVSTEEKEAFENRFNVQLMNTYGSTESLTWVITDPPHGPRNWPSVGRVGLSYEVKTIDDQGSETKPGELGEFIIKGTPGVSLMKEYFNDPQATGNAISKDGWLHTGDKGYVDEAGWFYFVDRKTNIIKRGGKNISAAEIESVLASHDAVCEAAVIGIEDPIWDQAIKAFVVLVQEMSVSEEELLRHCACHLAAYKVPETIEFKESLPRTSSMKIEKKNLN